MKRLVIGVTLAGVLLTSAQAADLSMRREAYAAPPPPYSWTFCYIGVNGGGMGGTDSFSNVGAGGIAGGQIGCNYQIQQLVVGLEGEGDWSSFDTNVTGGVPGASTTTSVHNHWNADIAARFGFAWDRAFAYAKVGAVWLGDHYSVAAPGASTSGNATLPGFLFGLGAEYALSQQWTAKAEVNIDFVNSDSISLNCSGAACGVPTTLTSDSQVVVLGKVGLNYRF